MTVPTYQCKVQDYQDLALTRLSVGLQVRTARPRGTNSQLCALAISGEISLGYFYSA
jgi:hypothetical protein